MPLSYLKEQRYKLDVVPQDPLTAQCFDTIIALDMNLWNWAEVKVSSQAHSPLARSKLCNKHVVTHAVLQVPGVKPPSRHSHCAVVLNGRSLVRLSTFWSMRRWTMLGCPHLVTWPRLTVECWPLRWFLVVPEPQESWATSGSLTYSLGMDRGRRSLPSKSMNSS